MMSPSPSPKSDATIEPRKPSISEEAVDEAITVDPVSLVPDLPPVPHANATLVGGIVDRLDRVRDRVTVRVFGGGKVSVLFDPRTQVYRDGKAATVADLREGERIYLDTILDGSPVFARTIRLHAARATGDSQGVVLKYRADRGELTLRDALSPHPVQIRLTSTTRLKQDDHAVAASALVPGTLVAIDFSPEGEGHNTARAISILAIPGTRYTFAGQVVHIDLRTGLLVLTSSTDHKSHEVYLDPSVVPDENLHPGATVTMVTTFEGSRYVAHSLSIDSQSK
jgi:hypothetical protein